MPLRLLPLLLTVSSLACAQGTHLWNEASFSDWEKGTAHSIAIGSDGILSSGFDLNTVTQFTSADVWALASDKAGNAYVATGSPAQVIRIAPTGKQTVLFTSKDLSVQALSMGPDGALYAATLPSAKVFRLDPQAAKPLDETTAPVAFNAADTALKPKYIWAMQFDAQNRLYLATGAPGGIFRVGLKGSATPELFFASDEPHIRSLLFAPNGDLLAGSDGTGLVYRIPPAGKGLVVYEAQKREITSLALGPQGQLYVAAVGEKGRNNNLPLQPTGNAGSPATGTVTVTVVQPGSTQAVSNNAAVPEGSEVDLLPADTAQAPRRIWAAPNDVVYSLLMTPEGLLAATGNHGRVYCLHDDGTYQDIAHADAGQITGFAPIPDNHLLLTAANTGKLLRLDLAPAAKATLQSEVFDTAQPSLWGRAEVVANTPGYTLETHTGNVDSPARGWTDWKPVGAADTTIAQPPARYAQWRLTLQPGALVSQVSLNYLPANAAPEVDEVLVAPGTRVNASANQVSYPQQTQLTFASQGGVVNIDSNSPAAPLSAIKDKSSVTARWAAHDDNGDELRFALYYRAPGDATWHLLKDDLTDRFYSFDASLLPDGPYRLRVTVTDAPSHPAGAALGGERVSDLFLIDTATPSVTDLAAKRSAAALHVTAVVTNKQAPIARAEYSLDAAPWQYVEPVGRISDSAREQYSFDVALPGANSSGPHSLTLRAFDRYDNAGSAKVAIP